MKSLLVRNSVFVFMLALASIVTLGLLQYRAARKLAEDHRWISHTQDVLQELTMTRDLLNRADAAVQSFVITGDNRYIGTYGQSIDRIQDELRHVRTLTADSAKQQQSLDALLPLVADCKRALQDEIDARKNEGLESQKLLSLENSVRMATGNTRSTIGTMEAEESRLLRLRSGAAAGTNQKTRTLILFGNLLAFLLLSAAMVALYLDMTARRKTEESLRKAYQEQKDREITLRQLSGRLLRIQEQERRHMARDLHDSVGQHLAALKMALDSLQSKLRADPEQAARILAECVNTARDSIKEVRTVSYLLYPPMLEELGLKSAIPTYLEGFGQRSGIRTTLEISPELGRLPVEAEVAIFRVLQESLANVHRHSGSPTAHVRLDANDGMVRLEVKDEGKGMPPGNLEDFHSGLPGMLGVGLRGMNERMRQFGGRLEVASTDQGTIITATVPSKESQPLVAPIAAGDPPELRRSSGQSASKPPPTDVSVLDQGRASMP
jgi:signal transduction histidine kinase